MSKPSDDVIYNVRSQATYTPGPWSYRQWAQSDEDIVRCRSVGLEPTPMMGNSGERYVTATETGRIADVLPRIAPKRGKGYRHEDAERDANAQLISTAPELLKALKLLANPSMSSTKGNGESFIGWQAGEMSADNRLVIARAAIAKATGQQK